MIKTNKYNYCLRPINPFGCTLVTAVFYCLKSAICSTATLLKNYVWFEGWGYEEGALY